jgi:hypothetical protein
MKPTRGPKRRDPATLLPTLASCFSFDVRAWKRQGKLFPWNRFGVEWKAGRTPPAMLGVLVRENDIVLLFKRLDGVYDRLPLSEEAVAVEHVPHPVGGVRTWIVCPKCGKKVFKLYAQELRFECAECVNLPHPVDRLSTKDRKSLRLGKLNKMLGVPCWVPLAELRRPQGMHEVTFQKLKAERALLEAAGIRENMWLSEGIAAQRRERAEADQRRYGRQIKDGVIYLG